MIFTAGLMAQAGPGRGLNQYYGQDCRLENVIPDLTETQISELNALRLDQLDASQNYRNQIGEIRARQRTLMSENPLDQKAIDNLIDDKTTLMNKHLKTSAAHQLAVSEVLTDEQLVIYNQVKNQRQQFGRRGGRGNNDFQQGRPGMRNSQGRRDANRGNFNRGRRW